MSDPLTVASDLEKVNALGAAESRGRRAPYRAKMTDHREIFLRRPGGGRPPVCPGVWHHQNGRQSGRESSLHPMQPETWNHTTSVSPREG